MQAKKLKILRNTLGPCHKERDEFLFYCPKCEHHKAKFSINLDKNCYKCWVCDFSGRKLRRLIRRYGSRADTQAWSEFEDHVEISDFDELFSLSNEDSEEEIRVDLPEEFTSLANKKLPLVSQPAQRYLRERNVTQQDICRWKIGFCGRGEYEGYVVIPSFDITGRVNYFVARSYNGNWRKYKNPSVPRNQIIFDELFLNFQEDLVVVEGVFDAIVAGSNSVPLLGSTLSDRSKLMYEIIKNDTPVYLALDSDAENKSMRIIQTLLQYGIEVYKIDTSGVADVGEMSRQQFMSRKKTATYMTEEICLLFQALNV